MTNDELLALGVDPEIYEVFEIRGVAYGSPRYFEAAMAAGYYGCDDSQEVAFRRRA